MFNHEDLKLAINGGKKIFKDDKEGKYVHPKITKEIEEAVIEQLHETISIYDNSNIFKTFEEEFAKYPESEELAMLEQIEENETKIITKEDVIDELIKEIEK